MRKLEVCCYSVESALLAAEAGAHRIELCQGPLEGGTTPSWAAIRACVERVHLPLQVMVRPRGGDFLYSEVEYQVMLADIEAIKDLGVQGVVVGFLTRDGDIDTTRVRQVVELASPLEVTFHRAFDMAREPMRAMDQLIDAGVNRILTSGGRNRAVDATERIRSLLQRAKNDVVVMPGSGLNDQNLRAFIEATGAREVHASALMRVPSRMTFRNDDVGMRAERVGADYESVSVDARMVRAMVNILREAS